MIRLKLTAGQRLRLERQLKQTHDAHVYRRTLAILEFSRGRSITQTARTLGVTRQSIYNWIEEYSQAHDPASVVDRGRPGRPTLWSEDAENLLEDLLAYSPDQLGSYAVNWTVPLLQGHLEQSTAQRLSDETIRRELDRLGYVWKRTRYVLDPDPELEKQTTASQESPAVAAPERAPG